MSALGADSLSGTHSESELQNCGLPEKKSIANETYVTCDLLVRSTNSVSYGFFRPSARCSGTLRIGVRVADDIIGTRAAAMIGTRAERDCGFANIPAVEVMNRQRNSTPPLTRWRLPMHGRLATDLCTRRLLSDTFIMRTLLGDALVMCCLLNGALV